MKKYIALGIKAMIGLAVLLFLGLESLNFFTYTAPADQPYYAYLGFALTSGAMIGYLIIFLWDADTGLKRAIALTMMIVCLLAELVTAGFGFKINAWLKSGYELTQEAFDTMILFVQMLGMAHGLALILYIAGDPIIKAFKDDDGDGVPNVFDHTDNLTTETDKGKWSFGWPKMKRTSRSPVVQTSTDVKQEQLPANGNHVDTANPTHQPRH